MRKKTIVHIEFIFQPYTDTKEEIGEVNRYEISDKRDYVLQISLYFNHINHSFIKYYGVIY